MQVVTWRQFPIAIGRAQQIALRVFHELPKNFGSVSVSLGKSKSAIPLGTAQLFYCRRAGLDGRAVLAKRHLTDPARAPPLASVGQPAVFQPGELELSPAWQMARALAPVSLARTALLSADGSLRRNNFIIEALSIGRWGSVWGKSP